jgi:hypothetical protein
MIMIYVNNNTETVPGFKTAVFKPIGGLGPKESQIPMKIRVRRPQVSEQASIKRDPSTFAFHGGGGFFGDD